MDQPKLERLLRLMKLLTANTTYNVDQLAERLQMSRRTIYRYIDTFREAGFVIKKAGDCIRLPLAVALRKESVDRNIKNTAPFARSPRRSPQGDRG